MKTDDKTIMMIKGVDRHQHDQFKSHAARRGIPMSPLIRAFITSYNRACQQAIVPEWVHEIERTAR